MNERDHELRCRVALALTRKFTPLQLTTLIESFGSIGNALSAPRGEAQALRGITKVKLDLAHEIMNSSQVDEEFELCEKTGAALLMLGDEEYPTLLREIADPPLLLWQRGELKDEDRTAVAVVGSRNASIYGTQQATRFAREFGTRRLTVVSGLARGIDTAAHKGALEGGGRTIAVVGSGLEELYPPENVRLSKEIVASGVLLSEFPLKTPAHARNFPQRNRIISGMCMGTLVVQASQRSGSLITARLAGEQGREVFAIPGKIDSEDNSGCHALIRDGVKLVESPADVLSDLHGVDELPSEAPRQKTEAAFSGTQTELALYKLLKPSDPVNIEEMISKSGLAAAQVTATLMTLEMRGLVKLLPGKNYVLAER